MKAVETGWFSRDSLPEELNFKPVSDIIFNGGPVGENGTRAATLTSSPWMAIARLCCVLLSTKRKLLPLAEVKDQVTALVKHNKAEQQAKLDADKLLAALKAGKGDEAMKAAGLSFGEAKTLSRTGQDPLSQRRLVWRCRRMTSRATA